MTRRLVVSLLVVVASLVVLFPQVRIAAQTPAAVQWYSVNIVRVKPSALNDWLALQQKETIPGLQKAGVAERQGWQVAQFGPGFEYFFLSPIPKFAQYDNPQSPIVRALGEAGARAYNDKLRTMIESTQTLGIQMLPESIAPPATFEPKLAILTFHYVAPGRGNDFLNYLRNDFMPAIKKAKPIGYAVSRTIHGGDANEFVTGRYLDKFADLDEASLLTKAVGAEAADKINAKVAGIVTHQERRVYRFVPTLSFRPKAASSR
jgi:hypothetical protein